MFLQHLVTPYALLALPFLYFFAPYLQRWQLLKIPGPWAAALSNLWLMYHSRQGKRYRAVDEAHKKYGKVVRIQPNHVSIADAAALPIIYGHGTGFLKSEYYDAFVSIRRGLFNTRDRAEHTRKRKTVSHTFSAKSIGQFEQYIHANIEMFVQQWDNLTANPDPKTGYASIDALHWFNYLAFDIIGDLAFGQPFGMVEKGRDYAEVRKTPDSPPIYASAIEVLNRRGEVSTTLGCMPWLKPYAKYLPDAFFRNGIAAVENLAGIAIARVSERLSRPSDRVDLLARLMEGRDEKGEKLGREELTAEALTQLIAGSDTTSNTSCALLNWVVRTPGVQERLQAELDEAIPAGVRVPEYSQVKDLEYVDRVIKETLRIHSTSSLGLPRLSPQATPQQPNPPNVEILGYSFPPGTSLSVPAYTIHHSTEIWGADADAFNPDRWLPDRVTETQKAAFIPFSTGPRACVGRNVAEMELAIIVATVFKNYEFVLEGPEKDGAEMGTREGFLRKPTGLDVGLKRRQPKVSTT